MNEDVYDFAQHYAIGMAGVGIPSLVMLTYALAQGDKESIIDAALVEGAVLGTQFGMLQAINYVSGPKYAMRFHKVHQGMNVVRGLASRAVTTAIAPALTAAVMGAAIVTAGDRVLDYLTDGMAGIMPDVDFMKFTQY